MLKRFELAPEPRDSPNSCESGYMDVTPMKILGIDPGLNTTGYGVIEASGQRVRLVEAGVVRGGSSANRTLAERVAEVYRGVTEVIESHSPAVMAIEELYSHYERPKTAILMGHARGAIILAGQIGGLQVSHYA